MDPNQVPATQPANQPSTPPQVAAFAPEPKKKRLGLKITLGVIGVLIVLVVIGVITAFTATSGTVKTANAFVDALVRKDYNTSYSYFSDELKEVQTRETFEANFVDAPFDSNCKLNVTHRGVESKAGSPTIKTLEGAIKCGNTSSYPTKLTFVNTDNGEKLLSYKVDPAK